jgi:hypothetical protein
MNCPPAFAAEDVRAAVLSQMRFTYRYRPWVVATARKPEVAPRREYSKPSLRILEEPWPGATTADLVTRMEWHAGLGGASFVAYRQGPGEPHLQVLRPDWCALLYGSDTQPENPGQALDGVFLGTIYWNGGYNGPWGYPPEFLLPDECIHWIPKPDPLAAGAGMSWLTPAIRDIKSDALAGDHKIRYWINGATPNLVAELRQLHCCSPELRRYLGVSRFAGHLEVACSAGQCVGELRTLVRRDGHSAAA